jgi:hypothetical protein
MTGDEVRRVVRHNGPVGAGKLLELNGGADVGIEAPATLDGAGEEDGLGLRLDRSRGLWRRLAWVSERIKFGGLERFGITQKSALLLIFLKAKAAGVGVGKDGDVGLGGCAGRGVKVEDEIVGEVGGKDEWSTFDGKDDGGFNEAGDLIRDSWTERRRRGCLDGRECDDEH